MRLHVRTWAHARTLKNDLRTHVRTRTHISEKFLAPICTKIAATAHVRAHALMRTKGFEFWSNHKTPP